MCYVQPVSIVAAANQIAAMQAAQEQERMSAMAYRSMGEAALKEVYGFIAPRSAGSVESKLTPRGNCPSCGSGKYTRKAQGYVCDHCGNNR